MKPFYYVLVVGMVLFASCNWNLPGAKSALPGPVITTVCETGTTVEKESVLYDGILNSYSIRFIDNTTTRSVGQIQYYSASGVFLNASKFIRDTNGEIRAAYYDNTSKLRNYDVYTYDAAGFVTGKDSYDASGVRQSSRRYAPKSTGTAKGELESAAYFPGTATTPTGGVRYFFIDTSAYASETWNMEVQYGEKENADEVAGRTWADDPKAGAVNSTTLKTEKKLTLVAPARPTPPNLSIPSDFPATSSSFAASGYRFYFKDDYGSTSFSADKAFYPASASRTDKRIDGGKTSIKADLTRDESGRITTQSTYYGDTLALKVDIDYDGDTWFPLTVTTTGAVMMVPITYAFTYLPSNHAVDTITVKSWDTSLIILKYTYKTALPAQTAKAINTMDPFTFLNALIKTDVVISHYKGDGTLIETFTPVATTITNPDGKKIITGVDVRVNLPKDDGSAGGKYNGSYVIGYNAAGQCVSLQSKGADGTVQWTQSTASVSDVWADLTSAASGAIDQAVSFGPLLDSFMPAGGSQSAVVSGISENFLYNLIF